MTSSRGGGKRSEAARHSIRGASTCGWQQNCRTADVRVGCTRACDGARITWMAADFIGRARPCGRPVTVAIDAMFTTSVGPMLRLDSDHTANTVREKFGEA